MDLLSGGHLNGRYHQDTGGLRQGRNSGQIPGRVVIRHPDDVQLQNLGHAHNVVGRHFLLPAGREGGVNVQIIAKFRQAVHLPALSLVLIPCPAPGPA